MYPISTFIFISTNTCKKSRKGLVLKYICTCVCVRVYLCVLLSSFPFLFFHPSPVCLSPLFHNVSGFALYPLFSVILSFTFICLYSSEFSTTYFSLYIVTLAFILVFFHVCAARSRILSTVCYNASRFSYFILSRILYVYKIIFQHFLIFLQPGDTWKNNPLPSTHMKTSNNYQHPTNRGNNNNHNTLAKQQ